MKLLRYLLLLLLTFNLAGCDFMSKKYSCEGVSKEMFSSQSVNSEYQSCMFLYLLIDRYCSNLSEIAETKTLSWTFVNSKDDKLSISSNLDIDEKYLSKLTLSKKDENEIIWDFKSEEINQQKDKETTKVSLTFNEINNNFNLRKSTILKFGEKPSYLNYKNDAVKDATYSYKEISGKCKKI
jgi:hypothetical protein